MDRLSWSDWNLIAAGGFVTFDVGDAEVVTDADAATPLLRAAEDAGLNPITGAVWASATPATCPSCRAGCATYAPAA